MALIPAVVDAAGETPVVAAGGIGDGRGLAAALMLGASGIWIGTRFAASAESAAHSECKRRLTDAREDDTFYSSLFDVGWPKAPHRTLTNSTIREWIAAGRPEPGARPGEGEVIASRPGGQQIHRYEVVNPTDVTRGNLEACPLMAGQSVSLVTPNKPGGRDR